jgi:hypothetical protein
MIAISAHFDGKVIVPDEPVDLPRDQALIVRIEPLSKACPPAESVLAWLAENPLNGRELPTDLSHQHDHYLYGLPKKDA